MIHKKLFYVKIELLYRLLGKDPYLAVNYLVPFWNGVDLRYKLLKSPEVKLNIAGIILAQVIYYFNKFITLFYIL